MNVPAHTVDPAVVWQLLIGLSLAINGYFLKRALGSLDTVADKLNNHGERLAALEATEEERRHWIRRKEDRKRDDGDD